MRDKKGQVYDMKKGNNKNTIINYIPFYVLGAKVGRKGDICRKIWVFRSK